MFLSGLQTAVPAEGAGGISQIGIDQLTGDVTAGPGSGSQVATISNNAVTYAKMQDISAASRLLGRGSAAGAGDPQEISLGSGLTMTGTTLSAAGSGGTVTNTGTLTSGKLIQGNGGVDVTVNATTATVVKLTSGTPSAASAGTDYVAPGAVTTSGLTQGTGKLLGRSTAGTGAIEEITVGSNLTLSGGTLSASSSGTVTTTGSPASGNLTQFSGASSITNGDLSGDVSTSGTLVTKFNGTQGHLHGLQRVLGDGSTTTFDLLDNAEYLEHVGVGGSFQDPATFSLSSGFNQIVFASAPSSSAVITIEYVVATI